MCKVNGKGKIQFAIREWVAFTGIMISCAGGTIAAMNYILDLKLAPISVHLQNADRDIHHCVQEGIKLHEAGYHGVKHASGN